MKYHVDERGYYGPFGGAYLPEMLFPNVETLREHYLRIIESASFQQELRYYLSQYVGRPTPLYRSAWLSEKYGASIYLKREDLCHTGSHKINNALGQVLLAKALGKTNIIAETGAGQHGVATATACALLGMKCTVFMGKTDVLRQHPNVERMLFLGAKVETVSSGSQTLKDATNEALRYWIDHADDTHYVIGSVVGPHPYPDLVARLQAVISKEIITQLADINGDPLPTKVLACVGGGSNAAGAFFHFLEEETVQLFGVEAAGKGIHSGESAATTQLGSIGVLHACKTLVMQTADGQVIEPYSISAGLDYPGIGPLHASLHATGRVRYLAVTDEEALAAGYALCRREGIIPAIESAHALAALDKIKLTADDVVVVNLSGRGDKDMETYIRYQNNLNMLKTNIYE